MPIVKKEERYVAVAYELMCQYERATALANNLNEVLKDDPGFEKAEDDTRGWDGPRMAVVVVTYWRLKDAIRLDKRVRELLSLKVDFTYEADIVVSYGSRGPIGRVKSKTAIQEIPNVSCA